MFKYRDANNKDIAAHIVYAKPHAGDFALYEDEEGNIPASGVKLTESFLNNTLLFRVWPEGANGYAGYIKPSLMEDTPNSNLPAFAIIMSGDDGLIMHICLCLAE